MLTKCAPWLGEQRKVMLQIAVFHPRRFASSAGGHGHGDEHHDDPKEPVMEKQPDMYRPGSDSYAYENPWPKLNKGRLDWMFNDGWRRPLAPDQGLHMRKNWLWLRQYNYNEYKDWRRFHKYTFRLLSVLTVWLCLWWYVFFFPDWPIAKDWAWREAHMELLRRERAGLPLISPDLIERSRVEKCLPSDEELGDFEILV